MRGIGRIDSIQALRGIAATMVAGFHLYAAALAETGAAGAFAVFRHGEAGVDIFFVISGFIITLTAGMRPEQTATEFALARFWRIFPPYWIILALYLGLAAAARMATGSGQESPGMGALIISVLLLPYPAHVVVIAWTLSVEILFYALFCLTFVRFGARAFVGAMLVWVALSQIYRGQDLVQSGWLDIALNTVVLEFLFGAAIAFLHLGGRRLLHLPALALGIAGLGLMLALPAPPWLGREFAWGVPAALIVHGALGWRRALPVPVVLWGDSSYILYLLHLLVFSVLGRVIGAALGSSAYGSGWVMLAMLAAAIGTAALASLWLERPYLRWVKARMMRGQVQS